MTAAEYLTAHAVADQHAGYSTAATLAFFRRHGMSEADLAALEQRGNGYRRGVPELPQSFDRLLVGDTRARGRNDVARHRRSWPLARACVALFRRARRADRRRHAAAEDQHQRQRLAPSSPTAIRSRASCDSISAFEALPPDTLVLPSHGLPFRGIPLRVAQLRAHHEARLGELAGRGARRHRAAMRGRARSRCCSGASSTSSSGFSRWARRSPISTYLWHAGTARPPRRRRRHAAICLVRRLNRLPPSSKRKPPPCHSPAKTAPPRNPRRRLPTIRWRSSIRCAPPRRKAPRSSATSRPARPRSGQSLVADELGIGKAFMELAAKMLANPYRLAESADEPVVGLHEPVADVDDEAPGRRAGARSPRRRRATSGSGTRTGRSISCSTTSSRATSSRRAGCTTPSAASRASTTGRRRRSTSSRASTSTRSRRRISR